MTPNEKQGNMAQTIKQNKSAETDRKKESYKFTIDIKIVVTKVINKLKKWPNQEHRRYQPSSFSSYRIRIDNYSQTKITVGGVTVSLSNMKKYSGVNKIDNIFSLKIYASNSITYMLWDG